MSENVDNAIRWLTSLVPGRVRQEQGLVSIAHARFNSTLWLKTDHSPLPSNLVNVDFYHQFDGADLFGSAFKLCSILEPRMSGNVIIVDTLAGLSQELRRSSVDIPPEATPFMVGSGQWVYFIVPNDNSIHEYDLEHGAVTQSYASLRAVVDEWAENVHGGA